MYPPNRSLLAVLGALALGLAVPTSSPAQEDSDDAAQPAMSNEGESLVAVARAQGNLSRFVALLEQSGLAAELSGGGPFTVFAPTDDAFTAIEQEGAIETLEVQELRRLVRTHVAMGEWTSEELTGADGITNLLADELQIDWDAQSVEGEATRQVDGANVIRVDVLAGNGVIHEIDAVLTGSPAPDTNASVEPVGSTDESASTGASGAGAGN